MLDRCQSIYFGFSGQGRPRSTKKAGTKGRSRHCSWLVARIKLFALSYAVLRGRIVKSRNWVRTLDICIPFSCDTNGRISAMN